MHATTMKPLPVRYLSSNVMKATSSSLALAASVLGFEITELWTEDAEGLPKCIYVHAEEDLLKVYPDILHGHYPMHKKEHVVSPNLCKLAKDSPDGGYWKIHTKSNYSKGDEDLHLDSGLSIRTKMAYMLQYTNDEEIKFGPKVYIIGFSTQILQFSSVKFKFLSGLGYAIYVAAFDLDEDRDGGEKIEDSSLDVKAFQPRVKSSMSLANLHSLDGNNSSCPSRKGSMDSIKRSASNESVDKLTTEEGADTLLRDVGSINLTADENLLELQQEGWNADVFSFPVSELQVKNVIPHDLVWNDFKKVSHIAEGSNANVFLAYWNNEKVIIKMIKEHVEYDPVAVHEFLMEQSILTRLTHPNIIKILGSGTEPRRFVVLEFLGGGSLNSILDQNQSKQGIAHRLFRRPSFTYQSLFAKARDIAEAFKYLHSQISDKAMIIHRDLKPDNVGFTSAGTLKLFDFGLCTCVRRRGEWEKYEMSGNTGSLRYMAPEVALGLPYTEKVDVYSFGIMTWQMARDRVPFKGMSREEFIRCVVKGGERPKLDKSWPTVFSKLLTDCWHDNPSQRPSFAVIVTELTSLIDEESGKSWARRGKTLIATDKNATNQEKASPARSTWF